MLSDSCLGNKQKNTVLKATTVVTLDEKRVPAFCRFTFIDLLLILNKGHSRRRFNSKVIA